MKGHPFEVALPAGGAITGVALTDQVRCIDWRARGARRVGVAPAATVASALARARTLLA